VAETGRPQMTVWRMRVACCITKATNTHSEYVIFLLIHGNNVYTNAPECYVNTCISCLVQIFVW